MKIRIGVLIALVPLACSAGSLCPSVESRGEGHWPLPEDYFTKERAELAAKKLAGVVDDAKMDEDEFAKTHEELPSQAARNASIIIRGYVLRVRAEQSKKGGPEQTMFCQFLEREAAFDH